MLYIKNLIANTAYIIVNSSFFINGGTLPVISNDRTFDGGTYPWTNSRTIDGGVLP